MLFNSLTDCLLFCRAFVFAWPTGMDDEICPYATFHLLGFREEMDPNQKNPNQFQTFPHPNGLGGAPPPDSMSHHRQGSQSMVPQPHLHHSIPSNWILLNGIGWFLTIFQMKLERFSVILEDLTGFLKDPWRIQRIFFTLWDFFGVFKGRFWDFLGYFVYF